MRSRSPELLNHLFKVTGLMELSQMLELGAKANTRKTPLLVKFIQGKKNPRGIICLIRKINFLSSTEPTFPLLEAVPILPGGQCCMRSSCPMTSESFF